jgi:hypothetical protein
MLMRSDPDKTTDVMTTVLSVNAARARDVRVAENASQTQPIVRAVARTRKGVRHVHTVRAIGSAWKARVYCGVKRADAKRRASAGIRASNEDGRRETCNRAR